MTHSDSSTKDLIRDTAMDLFRENGYENVTIMDICRGCNITKRTFYYHFESKAQLLSGVVDYWGIKAERLINTLVSDEKNVDILWKLMRVYCINAQKYGPNILKQVYILMVQNGQDVHFPQKMYLYDLAVQLLTKAQNAGEIANPNGPEEIVFILYHALRSISISWAAENGSYNLVQEYRKSFDIIVGYPVALRQYENL